MTWKERRLITVLSVILAILSAALLIVLGIRYRQSRDAVQDPAAQAVQAAPGRRQHLRLPERIQRQCHAVFLHSGGRHLGMG